MDELDTGEFEMDEELGRTLYAAPAPAAPVMTVADELNAPGAPDDDLPLLDEGDFVFVGWTHDI